MDRITFDGAPITTIGYNASGAAPGSVSNVQVANVILHLDARITIFNAAVPGMRAWQNYWPTLDLQLSNADLIYYYQGTVGQKLDAVSVGTSGGRKHVTMDPSKNRLAYFRGQIGRAHV